MANIIKFVLTLCGLMASCTSAQLPSNPQVFFPSPFYFYNPATHPTQKIATSKGKPTTSPLEVTYHDHPQSTLIGSHIIFLNTCMKELKDSNDKLAQTSKLLEVLNTSTNLAAENLKQELAGNKQQLDDMAKQLTNTAKDLSDAIAIIATLKNDLNVVKQDVASSKSIIGNLNTTVTTNAKDLSDAIAIIATLKNDLNVVKQDVASSKSVIGNLNTAVTTTAKDLSDAIPIIATLKNDLNVVKQDVASSKFVIGNLNEAVSTSTAPSSIGKIPASCGDLQQIGHKKSGLYSVMGSNKIQTVYCDFTKSPSDSALQKWIGFADVQSLPTIFYVQRNGDFSIKNVPIPYENSVTNIGGAMDEKKGIFTAPRNGVYFFGFSGVGLFSSPHWGWLDVSLMKNGNMVGAAECNSNPGTAGNWETLSFQLTIPLKAGDQVWTQIIEIGNAVLHDEGRHFVHFNGHMLQEELSP